MRNSYMRARRPRKTHPCVRSGLRRDLGRTAGRLGTGFDGPAANAPRMRRVGKQNSSTLREAPPGMVGPEMLARATRLASRSLHR
jgi:hypothetical protein